MSTVGYRDILASSDSLASCSSRRNHWIFSAKFIQYQKRGKWQSGV